MSHKVLFVDDEPNVTESLKRVLHSEPYEVLTARSADEALTLLAQHNIDVVVSDEKMPGMSGSRFLALVRQTYPETIRMILTGHASLEVAIQGINNGEIYRFFTKPCNEVDLATTIRQALQQKSLMLESRRLVRMVKQQTNVLQELENSHPGITKVERSADGSIIIDDPGVDFDTLMKEIRLEGQKYETLLSDPKAGRKP